MTCVSAFEKALGDPNMNSALLPASARLSVPFKRLRRVPNIADQLPLHLLAVANVHGFEITRMDAVAALRVLSMNRHGSKMQAQLKALKGLVNGEPMVELHCPDNPSEHMVLKKPSWFRSTFEPRWFTPDFMCAVCGCPHSTKESRFWCTKCRICICCDCASSVGELKDELRSLKEEVDDDDSNEWSGTRLKDKISTICKGQSLQQPVREELTELALEAMKEEKHDFEMALWKVVPSHKH
jgi:hypothetical protein